MCTDGTYFLVPSLTSSCKWCTRRLVREPPGVNVSFFLGLFSFPKEKSSGFLSGTYQPGSGGSEGGESQVGFFSFEDFSLVILSLSLCLPLTPCYHTCVSKVAFFSHSHVFYALLPGWTVHCCMGWEKALGSNPGLWTSFLWSALCFNPAPHWTWGSSCEPLRVMKRSTYLPLASFIQTLEVVALLHLHWNLSLVAVTSFVFSLIASLLI